MGQPLCWVGAVLIRHFTAHNSKDERLGPDSTAKEHHKAPANVHGMHRAIEVPNSVCKGVQVCMKLVSFGSGRSELAKPSDHLALHQALRIKDQSGPNATIVPQISVVADMIPGVAAATATPVGIPLCYWGTRKLKAHNKSRHSSERQLCKYQYNA